MGIQGTLGTTIHKSTPHVGIKAKGIVHDVLPVRRSLFDNQISFPVKAFEKLHRCVLPGLVERFNTENSWMSRVSIGDLSNHV